MPNTQLDALKPQYLAIEAAAVQQPGIPMAAALQEAHDLATLLRDKAVREALLRVGASEERLSLLPSALEAARTAQSAWIVQRDRTKDEAQRAREVAGFELVREVIAAGRWNLRADAVGQATLDAISEGDGVDDMVQDLLDLAALVERKRSAFAADQTFDADAQITRARELSRQIAGGVSHGRLDKVQREAKDLRDRAYTYLNEIVSDLREAGRYAFRRDETTKKHFASDYRRHHRTLRVTDETPTPVVTPAVG